MGIFVEKVFLYTDFGAQNLTTCIANARANHIQIFVS